MRADCGGCKMGFTLPTIMLIYDWKMTFFQPIFSNKNVKKSATAAHLLPRGRAYHVHT